MAKNADTIGRSSKDGRFVSQHNAKTPKEATPSHPKGVRKAVMDIARKTLDKHEETWKELAKH